MMYCILVGASLLLLNHLVLVKSGVLDCGGVYTSRFGDIQSPSFPNAISNNLHCTWIINGTRRGDLVSLEFDAFSINDTESTDCSKTYIEISNYGSRGVRFCDDKLPPGVLDSESNIVVITLVTSAKDHTYSKGFILKYVISQKIVTTTMTVPKTIPTIPTCGGEVTAPFGHLNSPFFPEAQTNLNCIWNINAKNENDYIELAFNTIDINDDSKDCQNNYITFGDMIHENTLPRYCNRNKPTLNFISKTPSVFIKLVTDNGTNASPGFDAVYKMYNGNGSIISTTPLSSTPQSGESTGAGGSKNTGEKVAVGIIIGLLALILIVDLYNCRRQKGMIYYACTKQDKYKQKRLYNEL
eukprot:TCONS_00052732-protein